MNPPPLPPPKEPKKGLRQFFLDLKEDRALMLAELKMVCQEWLMLTRHHFETVKPVEPLVALHQQIETHTAVAQLDHLSDTGRFQKSGNSLGLNPNRETLR